MNKKGCNQGTQAFNILLKFSFQILQEFWQLTNKYIVSKLLANKEKYFSGIFMVVGSSPVAVR